MVQELELQGTETNPGGTEHSGATLLRIGILTLGVLCIIQATLNISLRLAFYSKEDADHFPLNSSVIADMCQIDQSPQNSTQSCSCYKNLLRILLREYRTLETERDILRDKVIQLIRDREDDFQESGSGTLEEVLALEMGG